MRTSFSQMSASTKEDWEIIGREQLKNFEGLPDRVLEHLRLLEGEFAGFAVDRFQHSLQTAALAAEAGEDEEYVVCALPRVAGLHHRYEWREAA